MESIAAVELKGISKSFAGIRAVDDVSFAVTKGQFCTLLGPSGCGKTTTLRAIAGFEIPEQGALYINGSECSRLPPHRRDTAMVFQGYALFPHRTVLENVCFGLRMRRRGSRTEVKAKAREALALVGLMEMAGRYPAQLSGGQQQRVALARAIVVGPSVLLLDEPLSALDLKLRRSMRFELKRLQNHMGLTVIFVTHDQEEAMSLSDMIVVMDRGRIEQIGTPEDIYYRPVSRFVGNFIGESNIFRGTVAAIDAVGNVSVRVDTTGIMIACATPAAAGRGSLTAGDPVSIVVRAASVDVHPEGKSPGSAALRGVLVQRAFTGATTRLYIKMDGLDQIVIADLPSALAIDAQQGQVVSFDWSPAAALLVRPA